MKRSALVFTLTVVTCVGIGASLPELKLEMKRREPARAERGEPMTALERKQLRQVECEMTGCAPGTNLLGALTPLTKFNKRSAQDTPFVVDLDSDSAARVRLRAHTLSDLPPVKPFDIFNGKTVEEVVNPKPQDSSSAEPRDRSNGKLLETFDWKTLDTSERKTLPATEDFWREADAEALLTRIFSNAELRNFNQKYSSLRAVRVELSPSSLTNRYLAYDGKGEPFFSGNDLGELISRLTSQLDWREGSIIIGLAGFTATQSMSFATELNVQQELFYPSHEWRPLASAHPDLRAVYQKAGITFEGMILTKIERPSPNQDSWHLRMRFTDGVRKFWVWMHSSSNRIKDFASRFANLLGSPNASQRSPAEAAAWTRLQLLATHPELTEDQFDIEIREELRSTHLGELPVLTSPEG